MVRVSYKSREKPLTPQILHIKGAESMLKRRLEITSHAKSLLDGKLAAQAAREHVDFKGLNPDRELVKLRLSVEADGSP